VPDIVTLTINPAIDIFVNVGHVEPTRKMRCTAPKRDPGGGGINVARVAHRLGCNVAAIYPTGGAIGKLLQRLVEREGIDSLVTPSHVETRENFTAYERDSGEQYRFVLPGSALHRAEWEACLDKLASLRDKPKFVVASGSVPPGVPNDFFARVVRHAKALGAKTVIDTSGAALDAALDEGVTLIKPNLVELSELAGAPLERDAERIAAYRKLVADGRAQAVALTLGEQGALLVTARASLARAAAGDRGGEHGRRRRQLCRRHGRCAGGRQAAGAGVSGRRGGGLGGRDEPRHRTVPRGGREAAAAGRGNQRVRAGAVISKIGPRSGKLRPKSAAIECLFSWMSLAAPPTGVASSDDRAEIIADGIVHTIGVVSGVASAVVLLAIAFSATHSVETGSIVIYVIGLLSMLGFSAAYNLWPVSPRKWLLRRFDHSAIYLLIAATYTPFLMQMKSGPVPAVLLIVVWLTAAVGIALKLRWPGRFDRLSIVLYLILGWSGLSAYAPVTEALRPLTLWLIAIGGALYSIGVIFHVWRSLRFQTAIWHGFVLTAAGVHYSAVLSCVTLGI